MGGRGEGRGGKRSKETKAEWESVKMVGKRGVEKGGRGRMGNKRGGDEGRKTRGEEEGRRSGGAKEGVGGEGRSTERKKGK